MINYKISRSRFVDVFNRLGWFKSTGKTGRYDIFTHPDNKNVWATLPLDTNTREYEYYVGQNVITLLYALGLKKSASEIDDIYSQLQNYNYKLINRIVNNSLYSQDKVPFEIAQILPQKNIDAFRKFYILKTKGKSQIPISNFELNHTQIGSFIIPVSIRVDSTLDQINLFSEPSLTNRILRDYLETIQNLIEIEEKVPEKYAKKIIERGIDSKIVKDFLNDKDSIAKYKEKYINQIQELSISSKSNPILDFKLKREDRLFKVVDLTQIRPVSDEQIAVLEKKEIELDSSTLEKEGIKIEATVDLIDQSGKAKFTVVNIGGEEVQKSFIAITHELSKFYLNICADAFKTMEPIEIDGDIVKSKGKPAMIKVTKLQIKKLAPTLFSKN